jgi:hypothetical protein
MVGGKSTLYTERKKSKREGGRIAILAGGKPTLCRERRRYVEREEGSIAIMAGGKPTLYTEKKR